MIFGRLLLADSHLGVAGGIHALLNDLFHSVMIVADERSLEEAIADRVPDLVVLDLSLPRSSEADLVGHLLATHPGLRLLVVSVHDEASIAQWFIAAGAVGFVARQSVGIDLLPAVRAVLAGGTYVSSAVHGEP